MEKTIHKLVYILQTTDEPLSINELALLLNVSDRTIRNYIDWVNKDEIYIEKTVGGYRLSRFHKPLSHIKMNFDPDDPIVRRKNILIDLTLSDKQRTSGFLNKYYISMSTLVNDVSYLKHKVTPFSLEIVLTKSNIFLHGKEIDKRDLLFTMISNKDYSLINTHQFGCLNDIEAKHLHNELFKFFSNNMIVVNDFEFNYIFTHLSILIVRIRQENIIKDDKKYNNFSSHYLTHDLINILDDFVSLPIPSGELQYISLLLSSLGKPHDSKILWDKKDYLQLTESIINDIHLKYNFYLNDNKFINRFSDHIQNLHYRSIYGISINNPLALITKNEQPLIYDIAAFTGYVIQQTLNITMDDCEIAFVAFHIGSFIISQSHTNKINVGFIYQLYNDIHIEIVNHINSHFSEEINLIFTTTKRGFDEIESYVKSVDLIISTDFSFNYEKSQIIHIPPFINNQIKSLIRDEIELIYNRKLFKHLSNAMFTLIKKDMFFRNKYFDDESGFIQFLGSQGIKQGYISSDFLEDTLKREAISPTSFITGVAVPHTLSVSAEVSFISFIINDEEVRWGNTNVRVIMMIGFSMEDSKLFREVFDSLINFLTTPHILAQLLQVKSHEQLMSLLNNFIYTH